MNIIDIHIFRWSDGSKHVMSILSDTADKHEVAERVFRLSHNDWPGNFTVSTGDVLYIEEEKYSSPIQALVDVSKPPVALLCTHSGWEVLTTERILQWTYESTPDQRVAMAMEDAE